MKKIAKIVCTALSATMLLSASTLAASCGKKETDEDAVISSFALSEVVNTYSYAENGLDKEIDYLLMLDADRLLANFRINAGIETTATAYPGGWENALIGGHTMGHYLSALAQAYANAGTPESDKKAILEKTKGIVSALKECQDKSKGEKGFLWGGENLGLPVEFQFDNVEKNKTNIGSEAWVPWYTMHKIIAGLIDVYNLMGNETAKTVVTNLGDWVYNRVSKWNEAKQEIVLGIEYGGMNDCMYNLYKITGNVNHAIAAHKFDEETLFNKAIKAKTDYLNNLHANTTIPKFIGALNRYLTLDKKTIDGEEVDASRYLEACEAFWDTVTTHHTYVTGGNSEWEHFGRDDILNGERTNCNCETCNSYNMLKLSKMLFSITLDKKYLDFYEGTYFNSILSSQNPETGMTTYFQPMATGYFKVYSTPESNFWCCTGSGMESFTKLNDSIYYKSGNEVYVSLYVNSTLNWESKGVVLKQTADLENSDEVSFTMEKGNTKLHLRVPDWTDKFDVSVNGSAVSTAAEGGFVTLDAKKGDTISVQMQKKVTAYNLPDGKDVYAFKYGPFVLSAELGTNNMKTTTTGVSVTIPQKAIVENKTLSITGDTVENFMAHINEHMVRNADGTFTLTGIATPTTYSYHFRQYTQRYGIYFPFAGNGSVEEKEDSYTKEVIDTVQPGYGQYEVDVLHAMQEENTVGVTNDGTYRYAQKGGYFTYRMKVEKEKTNYLNVKFRAADNGKTILIKSGDTELYKATLAYYGDDSIYDVILPIPAEVVANAEAITANGENCNVISLTFSGINGAESAKVCEFIYTETITFNGERDSQVAYFVDCGDYDTTTVSQGDKFGLYNSVTEQVYGMDFLTGKYWGILDNANPEAGTAGGAAENGVSTANTWAYEYNKEDGVSKTESNRYTKNQFERGVGRNLHYSFELENGDYQVELYFSDPWNCSKNPTVAANGETIVTSGAVNSAISKTVTVTNGELLLDITSSDLCINLCYIKISFA